jgi:hypothetical protein
MISTVTTTTVSAIASTTVLVASLSLIAILTLLALLIQKDLTTAVSGARARTLGRVLNIAILPLLMIFAFMVLVRLAEIR